MPLASGYQLGPYQIVTAIGAGGMGEVYRARDTTLRSGVVEHGQPIPLFTLTPGSTYDAAGDGQRFLVNAVLDEAKTPPIAVILNWQAGTKR